MKKNILNKVIKNGLIILLVALFVSSIFWLWFGRVFSIKIGYLEIDFFNTVCGIITIIGLIIAIYQISELKSEEDIILETITKTHEDTFKKESASRFGVITNDLINFQQRIANAQYSEYEINQFWLILNNIVIQINDINNRQNNLKSLPVISCENCITLLKELMNECDTINSQKAYGSFRKSFFLSKITEIISTISDCEQKLKI